MPDPTLYLKASIAVVIASAMIVLAFRLIVRESARSVSAAIGVLAVSAGLMIGYAILQFTWTWPPANALNRFLLIVLPAAVIVELLTAVVVDRADASPKSGDRQNISPAAPIDSRARTSLRVLTIVLRLTLYACVGRVLLHESVYMNGASNDNPDAWTMPQTIAAWSSSFGGLIVVRTLLCRLSERSTSCSITLSLAMAILCTGLTTMMAGYIKGGVAAVPLAAALVGTTLAASVLAKCCGDLNIRYLQGAISIGLIGLFGLLCIGHYFGQLTGLRAIVLFLTPLLCWISELPGLRSKPLWQKSAMRLIAVSVPLAAVLYFAWRDFDQKLAPLLASVDSYDTKL